MLAHRAAACCRTVLRHHTYLFCDSRSLRRPFFKEASSSFVGYNTAKCHAHSTAPLDQESTTPSTTETTHETNKTKQEAACLEKHQLHHQHHQQQLELALQKWKMEQQIYNDLRHDKNRAGLKSQLASIRSEIQQIASQLPEDLRSQLEDLRIQGRAQEAAQRRARVAQALQHGIHVVVDCSYAHEEFGSGSEAGEEEDPLLRSLLKQVEVAMAFNRRSDAPLSLRLAAFRGLVAQVGNRLGAQGWDLVKREEEVLQLYEAGQVVILSPDAPQPLAALEPGKAYVVGGIIDRSVKKNLTAGFAAAHGLTARRLPIPEHAAALGMARGVNTRPALNVSDVVIALVEFHRTGDWAAALSAAIPERKRRPQPNTPKPKRMRACDQGRSRAHGQDAATAAATAPTVR